MVMKNELPNLRRCKRLEWFRVEVEPCLCEESGSRRDVIRNPYHFLLFFGVTRSLSEDWQ
jgi:hypothetical protein